MKLHVLAIFGALALPTVTFAGPDKAPTADKTDKTTEKTTEKTTDKTANNNKLSDADTKIVAHLHHVNQMEIDLGKLAQKVGTASVKTYGETLVSDHQSADKDLAALAKQRRTTIPADKPETDADKQDQKEMMGAMARLKALKGAEFDKEFLNMMVSGHDKELAKIDVSIGAATDPDLQTMLRSIKPVLQRHSDQAHDLQKSPQASADRPSDRPDDKPLPSQR